MFQLKNGFSHNYRAQISSTLAKARGNASGFDSSSDVSGRDRDLDPDPAVPRPTGMTVALTRPALPIAVAAIVLCAACRHDPYITAPSAAIPAPVTIVIEAESGSGQGDLRERSRASGGRTLHLAPGEEHIWAVAVTALGAEYSIAVIYANGQEGPNETMTVGADGLVVASRVNRDSGDAIEGWNTFISDLFGVVRFGGGTHTIFLRSQGGDGCVEIDRIVLTPM